MTETSAVECSITDVHASHRMVAWIGGQKLAMSCGGRPQRAQSDNDLWLNELVGELMKWLNGQRSTTNEFMSMEGNPDHRVQTLLAIEQADAAAVVKLSAAIQAVVALGGKLP